MAEATQREDASRSGAGSTGQATPGRCGAGAGA